MHNERCMSVSKSGASETDGSNAARRWCSTLPYVPMARGFVYLAAVIDWFSRRVLSWRLSITMEAGFCVEAVEEALARHGKPEIFNTDQGSQFTSTVFTGLLIDNAIAISMDGRGALAGQLSLSRLNHWLPRGQAHPEVVQGTAEFHHQIADALLPQADPVFHDATALDAAVDMLDPQPTLVQRLVGPLLLQRAAPGRGVSWSA